MGVTDGRTASLVWGEHLSAGPALAATRAASRAAAIAPCASRAGSKGSMPSPAEVRESTAPSACRGFPRPAHHLRRAVGRRSCWPSRPSPATSSPLRPPTQPSVFQRRGGLATGAGPHRRDRPWRSGPARGDHLARSLDRVARKFGETHVVPGEFLSLDDVAGEQSLLAPASRPARDTQGTRPGWLRCEKAFRQGIHIAESAEPGTRQCGPPTPPMRSRGRLPTAPTARRWPCRPPRRGVPGSS